MKQIAHLSLWFLGLTSLTVAISLFMGAQDAMAVSFDYYSHIENPPVTRHEPPLDHINKDIRGRFGEVNLRLPRALAKKGLNALQSNITVSTLVNAPIEFIVEKYELVSERGTLEIYPKRFDREIEQGKMTISEARGKLWQTILKSRPVSEGGSPSVGFLVKEYTEPFKKLTLNFRVKITYQGQEEVIEDSIPLYRGRFTFTFFEYLRDRFYE